MMADRTPEDAAEQGSSNPGVARGEVMKSYWAEQKPMMSRATKYTEKTTSPLPHEMQYMRASADSGEGPG